MNEVAVQRFVEYIQIKTVQPEPDYKNALKFLKNYAQELGLEYQTIIIDDDREAAVLTVNNHFDFSS
jgi:aminoacylase